MSDRRLVTILGQGIVPPGTPVLQADDRGVLHGAGLFETLHVRHGRPWLPDEHLARLTRAATAVGLPLPPTADLAGLLDEACARWPIDVEGALRLVCTPGPEGDGETTVFATLSEVDAAALHGRHEGIRVITLPLGVAADARAAAPWLLAGIKSTSYAVNLAARRWATGKGADDALWISTDGYVLEGPTANLVWLAGGELCTVPAETTGILPGVTARWLLDHAGAFGWSARERMITPAELHSVDGAWFTSSVRGVAELRFLDGTTLARSPHTGAIRELLGFT